VVVGCLDPNEQVAGRGVAQLREARIEVIVGVCEASCRQLIAPFYARQVLRRPYVTLKWARTIDGKVSGPGGARLRITGATASDLVQGLRSRSDAILVGVNTVLADDPLLTVRGRPVIRPLTRVVLDRQLRTPFESQLVRTARDHPLLICCDLAADEGRAMALEDAGARVEVVNGLEEVMGLLHAGGCTHLLVEPGPTLAASFVAANLVDRVWLFRSGRVTSPDPTAVRAPLLPPDVIRVAERDYPLDLLQEFLNVRSDAFFGAEPSADVI
jgi:diaminohydroxyphosphoribosylaminopyrimidine deaminase/5-amino-6-(5-phosphoribosylamino)uracil reductase